MIPQVATLVLHNMPAALGRQRSASVAFNTLFTTTSTTAQAHLPAAYGLLAKVHSPRIAHFPYSPRTMVLTWDMTPDGGSRLPRLSRTCGCRMPAPDRSVDTGLGKDALSGQAGGEQYHR